MRLIPAGKTDVTLTVFCLDSTSTTGAGKTGLTDANITARYWRHGAANDSGIVMTALASLDANHADGGWKEINSGTMPGWYRFDIPDAVCADGSSEASISLAASGMAPVVIGIDLKLSEKEDIADAVWDEVLSGHTTEGTAGYELGGGGGEADWSTAERSQIRYRLGIDGTAAAPTATSNLGIEDLVSASVAPVVGQQLGDREVGSVVIGRFETFSTGTLTGGFVSGAGGTPTYVVERLNDRTTSTLGLTVTHNVDGKNGIHHVAIDTTASSTFYALNKDYVVRIADGKVMVGENYVTVTNQQVLSFNLQNTCSGKLLDRAVKVQSGTVLAESPRTAKEFKLQISGAGTQENYYRGQILQWQPGAANQGLGRVILQSTTVVDKVTIKLTEALPAVPNIADVAVIIPEEQPMPIAVGHITAEFSPQTKVFCDWSLDGSFVTPDTDPTVNVWNGNTGVWVIQNRTMTKMSASSCYFYQHTSDAIQPNEGAVIQVSATIDGIAYNWRRTYPYAQV